MKLSWKTAATIFALVFVSVPLINHIRVNTHAVDAMEDRDIEAFAYYRYGVFPNSIVLDLRSVGPESSIAGTIGGLIRFAENLSDREFDEVVLAWNGDARFIMDGKDFREIGRTASYENPAYTVRTLPEKLRRPDGSRAFSVWTGGLIGVLGAQMEDVNDFADQWYLDDVISRR